MAKKTSIILFLIVFDKTCQWKLLYVKCSSFGVFHMLTCYIWHTAVSWWHRKHKESGFRIQFKVYWVDSTPLQSKNSQVTRSGFPNYHKIFQNYWPFTAHIKENNEPWRILFGRKCSRSTEVWRYTEQFWIISVVVQVWFCNFHIHCIVVIIKRPDFSSILNRYKHNVILKWLQFH